MKHRESPRHVIEVEKAWVVDSARSEMAEELHAYIAEHPEECNQLEYGEVCWFDDEWREYGEEALPQEPGKYAAWMWSEGPDYFGEWDGGIEWQRLP